MHPGRLNTHLFYVQKKQYHQNIPVIPCCPKSVKITFVVDFSKLTLVLISATLISESAEEIWDSVTGVSSQGRKRGRASRGKMMKRQNFSAGRLLGVGG